MKYNYSAIILNLVKIKNGVDKLKFKVFFIKSKYIFYFILFLVLFTLMVIYLNMPKSKESLPTFYKNASEDSYKLDLTGDGQEDNLYIIKKDNKYSLNINTNLDSVILKPNSKSGFFGEYSTYWPFRIRFQDLNRDNTPEILIQSTLNNKPIQHVVVYDNVTETFNDLICNNNNLLGIIDLSNNKTPKLISANISTESMTVINHILIKNNFNKFTYTNKSDEGFFCKSSMINLINFISTKDESLYKKILNDFCSKDIDSKSLNTLNSISSYKEDFVFQHGFFKDIKSNKEGYPIELEWVLSFRKIDPSQNNNIVNNNFTILIKENNMGNYVINSVTFSE